MQVDTQSQERKAAARKRLNDLQRPIERRLSIAAGLSVLSALMWIAQAALVADLMAALARGGDAVMAPWIAAGAFLGIGLIRAGLNFVSGGMAFGASDEAISRARHRLIAGEATRAPLSPGNPSSAAIASLGAEKLAAVSAYLVRYRPAQGRAMTVPLVIAAVAFTYSWAVGLILLVSGPLIPVFMALVGLAAREASERQMEEIASMNVLLLERVNALADIRLLDATAQTLSGFREAADRLRRQTMEVLRIAFLSSAVLELFSAIGVAMVAVYVGFALLGEFSFGAYATPLTIGEGIFLLLLAPDFFQPMRDLAAAWHDRAGALAVAGELAEIGSGEPERIAGTGGPATPSSRRADIVTRGLSYRAGSGATLRFPDLDIPHGASVAIAGPSGVGKTTLFALLAGLARPCEGTVLVAGRELDDSTADAWRSRLGWIGQTPHFLNASLQHNLTLSDAEIDRERMAEAIRLAAAEGIVAALPRGRLTRLGENGFGVSGGEARRLLVARALYSDADVVFADEPTADLDEETAGDVIKGLQAISERGSSLIIATHDKRLLASMRHVVNIGAAA